VKGEISGKVMVLLVFQDFTAGTRQTCFSRTQLDCVVRKW